MLLLLSLLCRIEISAIFTFRKVNRASFLGTNFYEQFLLSTRVKRVIGFPQKTRISRKTSTKNPISLQIFNSGTATGYLQGSVIMLREDYGLRAPTSVHFDVSTTTRYIGKNITNQVELNH